MTPPPTPRRSKRTLRKSQLVPLVTPFRRLLQKISLSMEDEDLGTIKSLLWDTQNEERRERYRSCGSALEVFLQLEEENIIGDNDDERLEYILQLLESTENFGRGYFKDDIDAYKVELENEENLQRDHVTFDLVGRDDDMNELLEKIDTDQREHVKVVSITGLGGVGKTTFAHHACARQEREEIFIDLREVTSVENVHLKIMRELGYPLIDCEPERVYATIRNYSDEEAVMILDNADGLLEKRETREQFLETLANFEKQRNNQIQMFVTTRVHLIADEQESPFNNLILSQLDVLREGGAELVRKLAGKDIISPKEAKDLADRCGNWPIAIRVVCSQLRDGTVKPGDMLNRLKTLQNIKEIREFMLQAYKSLPLRLQHVLVQISVFAGPFTEEAAEEVLDSGKKVGFLLMELKMRNLISASPGGPSRYDMHDLLRNFLSSLRVDKDFGVGQIIGKAEYRFKKYYEGRMRDVAKTMKKELEIALKEYDDDSANFTQFLHLVVGETADVRERYPSSTKHEEGDDRFWLDPAEPEMAHHQDQASGKKKEEKDQGSDKEKKEKHQASVGVLLEQMLTVDERIRFYNSRMNAAKEQGKWQCAAEMMCWLAENILQNQSFQAARRFLDEAFKTLQSLPNRDVETVRLSLARYHYVEGNYVEMFRTIRQSHTPHLCVYYSQLGQYEENVQQLQKALEIQSEILKDDIMTARTVNSLGYAHHHHARTLQSNPVGYMNILNQGLERHRQAYEMVQRDIGGPFFYII
ncbi:Hypp2202 [Branchiostoma lanceolatum]|uniref:Hypp2202 protein n=1 Tax=Branchiostoma lanceolatum TaxID=7740 RepID=A0A8K0ERT1_BRALA|nr:Hypp2202 [Branchiostoma lanceolatum]